jgi:hypothetical protein
MITIKNNLNQPIAIGEGTLPAGGEIKVRAVDEEIERLAAKGHVTIVAPEPEPDKDDKKGEKK